MISQRCFASKPFLMLILSDENLEFCLMLDIMGYLILMTWKKEMIVGKRFKHGTEKRFKVCDSYPCKVV